MSTSSSPFKSYDIRGLVGQEITPEFAYKLGLALIEVIKPKTVLVGYDMRQSSPDLAKELVRAFLEQGIHSLEIGICTTPVFYHAVAERPEVDLGVVVTASHNPSEYNGFKLTRSQAIPIGSGSGMEEIAKAFERLQYNEQQKGTIKIAEQVDGAVDEYVTAVIDRLPDSGEGLKSAKPKSLRFIADAGNGMAGLTLPVLIERLPALDLQPLYWELDGTFPNHEANPLHTATLKELQVKVVAEGATAGFAFDGDGDRIGVVVEKGDVVPGDMLTALLAQELLRAAPGSTVLNDLRCSWSTAEAIREAGGTPELCRVGHAHIKKQMRERNALFGGELSMHFYFAAFAYCEASEYAMLLLVDLLKRTGKPLSELWRPFLRYSHSGEKNYKLSDETPAAVLGRLEKMYVPRASSVSRIDGLRCEFVDPTAPGKAWWFSVRASNTEPLLRLNLEARQPEVMHTALKELECVILSPDGTALSSHSSDLSSP